MEKKIKKNRETNFPLILSLKRLKGHLWQAPKRKSERFKKETGIRLFALPASYFRMGRI